MSKFAKLALALGLAESASEEDVFTAASKSIMASIDSQKNLTALSVEAAKHGLKLEGSTLVKVEPVTQLDTTIKPEDDAEKAELKKAIAANALETAKMKLSAVKGEAEAFVMAGKCPPALKEKLVRIISSGWAVSLSLSADGSQVVRTAVSISETVKEILSAMPGLTSTQLTRLSGEDDAQKKAKEALSTKAKGIAARAQGRTESTSQK